MKNPHTLYATTELLEFEAKLLNLLHYFWSVAGPSRTKEISLAYENLVSGIPQMCDNPRTPSECGVGNVGHRCLVEESRARFLGPQVRPQFGSRDPGLFLDRQDEFGGDAALRFLEPVPDLGLRGADAVS